MGDFNSIAAFKSEVAALGRELETTDRRRITRQMAERGQQIADQAAAGDIGGSFSGWRRGRPIPLDTRVRSLPDGDALLVPTRASAGPWTVAERGRNQGNASGFSGPGVNRRTGATARTQSGNVRRVRATTGRSNWNGRTAGKRTASDAVDRMEQAVQQIAERGVNDAIRRHFD